MNLYLLTQDDADGYDTYDSAIVCAENEKIATSICPSYYDGEQWDQTRYRSWASSPDLVHVKLIGVADNSISRGVVLASFNAG